MFKRVKRLVVGEVVRVLDVKELERVLFKKRKGKV